LPLAGFYAAPDRKTRAVPWPIIQAPFSEAAFAKLCGVCPISASSGKTIRHRLNRGGNRRANAALYRVAVVRMRWRQPTIDYVQRRTAEGKSTREIRRCLKRYIAREIFQHLCSRQNRTNAASDAA
jgi:transposase